MSRRKKNLIFAYLAVCPLPRGTTADGLEVGFPTALRVESISVACGSLSAKLSAKNSMQQCGRANANRWRALFGFHTSQNAYKQFVRPSWNKALKHGWQEALREGMKLGWKYSEGIVYVSSKATSNPPCPLLTSMQYFCKEHRDHNNCTVEEQSVFWKAAVSKVSLAEIQCLS